MIASLQVYQAEPFQELERIEIIEPIRKGMEQSQRGEGIPLELKRQN